jgi:hypothetical protein
MEYGNFHPTVLYTIDSLVYAYSKYGSHDIGLNVSLNLFLLSGAPQTCALFENFILLASLKCNNLEL